MDKWGERESLTVEIQLINVEGIMELENHHLATITVVANSAPNTNGC